MTCPKCGDNTVVVEYSTVDAGDRACCCCGHQWKESVPLPPAVKRAFAACKTLATVAEHYLTGTQGRWLGVPNDDDVLRQAKGARRAIARAEGKEVKRCK